MFDNRVSPTVDSLDSYGIHVGRTLNFDYPWLLFVLEWVLGRNTKKFDAQ
jgi:hypothetical protein